MKKAIIIIFIFLVAFALWRWLTGANSYLRMQDNEENTELAFISEQIMGLEFLDLDGNKVRLSDFNDRPLVINSWAVWSPFSEGELKDFKSLQVEQGDKIYVIVINRGEELRRQMRVIDLIGREDLIFLQDGEDKFYTALGGVGMPNTIFIDEDGKIIEYKDSAIILNEMREIISKIWAD